MHVYVLDDKSYIMMTLVNQKFHSNVQSSRILFSWMCIRSLEEHTHKTETEISCALWYSFRNWMTKMHWCYSKYVCVSLKWHCSWPSRIDRNYIYYFLESWFNIIVQNHFDWNMVLFILFFRLFILCKLSCQSNSLFIWNDRVESSLLRFCAVEPATIFPLHHM